MRAALVFVAMEAVFDTIRAQPVAERWQSGRSHPPRKREYLYGYRGFESPPLRHCLYRSLTVAALFGAPRVSKRFIMFRVLRSVWIWSASVTLIVLWVPLLAAVRMFDREPL